MPGSPPIFRFPLQITMPWRLEIWLAPHAYSPGLEQGLPGSRAGLSEDEPVQLAIAAIVAGPTIAAVTSDFIPSSCDA